MLVIKDGNRVIYEGRYYNANYQACVIVAVTTPTQDWAAYINGVDASISEEDAVKWVAYHGCKMPELDARHYFPEIELPYRD